MWSALGWGRRRVKTVSQFSLYFFSSPLSVPTPPAPVLFYSQITGLLPSPACYETSSLYFTTDKLLGTVVKDVVVSILN